MQVSWKQNLAPNIEKHPQRSMLRPTPWHLHGIETLGDSQQPSYELLMRMATPTGLTYKHYNTTD